MVYYRGYKVDVDPAGLDPDPCFCVCLVGEVDTPAVLAHFRGRDFADVQLGFWMLCAEQDGERTITGPFKHVEQACALGARLYGARTYKICPAPEGAAGFGLPAE